MITIILNRNNGDFGFEVKDELNHSIQTDSSANNGGNDSGFRPMQLLLAALGSCSAIDIISILKKQRQVIDDFKIQVRGEREKDVIPSLWKEVSVTFFLRGAIDAEKAKKAADLSIEKYCSVAETLRRSGTKITWKTKINETNEADITQ
jgi:putative redox protein